MMALKTESFQQNRDSATDTTPEQIAIAKRAEPILQSLRTKLDEIDNEIIEALRKRQELRDIFCKVKSQHNIPVVVPTRMAEVLERVSHRANSQGLDPHYVRELFELVIQYSHRYEYEKRKKS